MAAVPKLPAKHSRTSVILQEALSTSTGPRPLGCDPLAYLAAPQVPSHPGGKEDLSLATKDVLGDTWALGPNTVCHSRNKTKPRLDFHDTQPENQNAQQGP